MAYDVNKESITATFHLQKYEPDSLLNYAMSDISKYSGVTRQEAKDFIYSREDLREQFDPDVLRDKAISAICKYTNKSKQEASFLLNNCPSSFEMISPVEDVFGELVATLEAAGVSATVDLYDMAGAVTFGGGELIGLDGRTSTRPVNLTDSAPASVITGGSSKTTSGGSCLLWFFGGAIGIFGISRIFGLYAGFSFDEILAGIITAAIGAVMIYFGIRKR